MKFKFWKLHLEKIWKLWKEVEFLEASFRAKADSLQEVHLPTLTNLIDQLFGTMHNGYLPWNYFNFHDSHLTKEIKINRKRHKFTLLIRKICWRTKQNLYYFCSVFILFCLVHWFALIPFRHLYTILILLKAYTACSSSPLCHSFIFFSFLHYINYHVYIFVISFSRCILGAGVYIEYG